MRFAFARSRSGPTPGAPALPGLAALGCQPAEAALAELTTGPTGLTDLDAAARLTTYGPNVIAHEQPAAWYVLLLENLANPFVLVLVLLGFVSFITGDIPGTLTVGVMAVISVLMRFFQEFRSSKAAEALRALVRTTATVTRRREYAHEGVVSTGAPERTEVPFEQIVPGDFVHLAAGDMVPADIRLISSKDLFISQATLTGEALPVEKSAALDPARTAEETTGGPLRLPTLCFMGTTVISGTATAVVVGTGARTHLGSLAKGVIGRRPMTSFDRGVASVTRVLIQFMLVMVPLVFLINGLAKHDFKEAFLFSIAVAVGLTPEMLPMVVTANLARGAVAMAREKVIVKRLNAIQNLGAMDVLCTDKTGTLTQDKVILERHRDVRDAISLRVLELAYLNSFYQTGLKSLLDRAVLEHVELTHELDLLQHHVKIDEIPFDLQRRRMSVIVQRRADPFLFICKGAVDEILAICTHVEDAGAVVPFDEALHAGARAVAERHNDEGFRVVAVAYKTIDSVDRAYTARDEQGLVLAGFIAFLDPPKESAGAAIKALQSHGVRVVVLTGDSDIVTQHVCRQVGLDILGVTTGGSLDALDDAALADLAERTTVFAKLNPLQKARVIRALQGRGHTVGFLGDGINDAAALRDADVGVSVDTATDIARESADIILLEKSLLVLELGVLRGREVYGNIIKYIKMTASSNFGNVFSVLIASAFLPFLPMLPLQLLIQNLLYDLSQTSLPWDRMDPEFLARPRRWEAGAIARFMVFIGPLSSIFDVTTFLLLWYVFHANSDAHQALFQSGWFIEGLLSQTLIVHMIRTKRIPFVQSTAATPVLVVTSLIMAIGIWIPFSHFGAAVGMVPLPWTFFPWLIVTLLAYCAVTQTVKTWYIARFGSWL
jgi:Mg2+-importing ATPase